MNLDRRTGYGFGAVNLPLQKLDLATRLQERFGVPVGIENDGNAMALAEWRVGAGRGATDLIALALGTGVGGGVVLDGRLYRGWAELGHVVVVADGPRCQGNCHGFGHLEAVASGEAAERAARRLWGDDADARTLVQERSTVTPKRGRRWSASGTTWGSRSAPTRTSSRRSSWSSVAASASRRGTWCTAALAAARRESLPPADTTLRIVLAELGDDAGLVGAGLVGFEALDGER